MQSSEKICGLAQTVLYQAAEAIKTLSHRIDQNFVVACQHLLESKGRIIVMGIGKSGHIGRKIAATFASTGSPAFFIHPSEAKHGDMGMITANDIILALSNSGETEEILVLIPYIKRMNIPLIALTGRPKSTLARAATVNIDVSVAKEACPLGLAPTTSTTAALVMGDALAIVLLENRGFTTEDFALSHPGGSLGRRLLLKVEEIMHHGPAVPKVDFDALLKTALVEMTEKKLGMTTIVDANGKLAGVFTDGDIRRAFDNNIDIHKAFINDLMSKNPKIISANTLAVDALRIMENYKITSLVVTNDHSHPIGVIHMHDILKTGVI
jgi:arabinose-5-phosphate isomerase